MDAPWARPEPWRKDGNAHIDKPEVDRDLFIQTVVDLRRAVDLLASRPDVDIGRMAFAGHSFGATWGGVLAGVEHRLKAYALMAGSPDNTDFAPSGAWASDLFLETVIRPYKPEQLRHYVEIVGPTDPIHYIGHATPASILMQFAEHDEYVGQKAEREYFQAASEPKQQKWYPTGHDLNSLEALRDRDEWLERQLGLRPLAPLFAAELTEAEAGAGQRQKVKK